MIRRCSIQLPTRSVSLSKTHGSITNPSTSPSPKNAAASPATCMIRSTQSLYSLTLFAEAGHRLLRSGEIERVEKYLERLNQTAQDALKEMRLLLYELRPWALESGKLVETIQHMLDAVERRSGLTAHLTTTPLPSLPPRFEENLYHITLEALNNALKHAFASAVTVQLCADERSILLDVTDNGANGRKNWVGRSVSFRPIKAEPPCAPACHSVRDL